MNILVGVKQRMSGWMSVSTMKDAIGVFGDVKYLVFHKSSESVADVSTNILKFLEKHKGCTIVYICAKDTLQQGIRMIVEANGGKYIDDEFFLEGVSQLNNLVNGLDEVVALTELSGTDILKDFFNKYSQSQGKAVTPAYLQLVKRAVSDLTDAYNNKNKEILSMCESANDLLQVILSSSDEQKKEVENLMGMVEDLKARMQSEEVLYAASAPTMGFQPSIFQTITYPKSNKEIVRIKDIGRSPYLTSFMFGYQSYLKNESVVRSRLIIVEPVGRLYVDKYSKYNWITQNTKNSMSAFQQDIVFTDCPTRDIMLKLINTPKYDIIIILDRLVSSVNHIISCKGDPVIFAVNGSSALEMKGVNRARFFSMIKEVQGAMFTVPMFSKYPSATNPELRVRKYIQDCSQYYAMIHAVKSY